MAIVDILARFLHITAAAVAVGGAFFLLIVVPRGLALVDESRREEVLLKIRRGFKMLVHPAILFLILSGVYNTIKLWPAKEEMGRYHRFWGPHLVLGLIVFGISLWLLAGKGLRTNHRTWLKVNVVLMMLTLLAGAATRWARLDIVKEKLGRWEADKAKLAELQRSAPPTATLPLPPPAPGQPAANQPVTTP
jgi:putative copper export protein